MTKISFILKFAHPRTDNIRRYVKYLLFAIYEAQEQFVVIERLHGT